MKREKDYKANALAVDKCLPLISIIIPVYNAEASLPRCMDSILAQTYNHFQVICVDDGSDDNSLLVLKKYKQKDERIFVISQSSNQGVSSARNSGIEKATGEWLFFVDADDFLDCNWVEQFIKATKTTDAEVIINGIRYIDKEGNKHENSYFTGVFTTLADKYKYITEGMVFNKIFKRSMIKAYKLRFPVGYVMEDNLFLFKALYYANKLMIISNAYYNYIYNSNSLCHVKTKEADERKLESCEYIGKEILKFAKIQKYDIEARNEVNRLLLRTIFGVSIFRRAAKRPALKKDLIESYGLIRFLFYRYKIVNEIARFFYRKVKNEHGSYSIRLFKIFKWNCKSL